MAVRHPRDGESCCAEGPPRVDCCVALGAELRASAAGCGVADGVDWRDWLVRSSLLSDNAWLAVRGPSSRAARRGATLRRPRFRRPSQS